MKVSNNQQNILFKGTHILKTTVLKRAEKNSMDYIPLDANIVELNYDYPNDKKAVDEILKNWHGAEFMHIIAGSKTSPERRVFVVTTQAPKFDDIDSKKILGIADYNISDSSAHLSFLQGNPEFISNDLKDIKDIGRKLVLGSSEFLKTEGCNQFKVFSRQKEKPFYRKVFPNIVEKQPTKEDCSNMVVSL